MVGDYGDDGARTFGFEFLDDPLDPDFRPRPRHDVLLRSAIHRPIRQSRELTAAVIHYVSASTLARFRLQKVSE